MKNSKPRVRIETVVNGGAGLGRLEDGRVVLVGKALPDEVVAVTVTETKKQYLLAEIDAIIVPHPARIEAPCRFYGACGGCDLQHCTSETQLDIKTAVVRDLYRRSLAPSERPAPLQEALPSPSLFGYRQRIRLQVDTSGRLGFRGPRSHRFVPVDFCLVAADQLNTVLAQLSPTGPAAALLKHCREVELLLNPATAAVVCLFHLQRKPRPADIAQAKRLADALPAVERVFFQGADFPLAGPFGGREQSGDNLLQLRLPPYGAANPPTTLSWEIGGFCQVNLGQNERLIDLVLRMSRVQGNDSVLDLFCGMGNFSIPLAQRAASLLGIEGQGSGIRSARTNSERAGCTGALFKKSPIHAACRDLVRDGRHFDCVVLDPPRQGVPDLAAELAALTGERMLYISCDPATLMRDLAALVRFGLSIRDIRPVDMFPQTHHIETVVLLEKN